MADQKTTALSAFTPVLSDILYGVDDPGGTPVSGKMTLTAVRDLLQANLTALTVAGGTITTSTPVLDGSQTWNDGAVTFTGLRVNVTDTASAAASLLQDWQVGGASQASVNKSGHVSGKRILMSGGQAALNAKGVVAASTKEIGFSSGGASASSVPDAFFTRDAAGTLALRNGENDQTLNVYSRHGSSTDFQRLGIKTTKATASAVSGASVTLSNLIPDGAVVVGVTSKVTTALGTSNGTTGYQVGDGTDPDRWGAATTVTLGTVTQNTDWTSGTIECFTSANNVVLTAVGGNFDGTGAIEVSVQYLIGQAD